MENAWDRKQVKIKGLNNSSGSQGGNTRSKSERERERAKEEGKEESCNSVALVPTSHLKV